MSSTSSDFKFSCNISFFRITTILSWRYAYSLIRLNIRRQYRACPCHLFCSVVLVNIIILLWCWAYMNPTDNVGTTPYWNTCFEVCVWHTLHSRKLLSYLFMIMEPALCFRSFINLFSHLSMAMSTEDWTPCSIGIKTPFSCHDSHFISVI
jgi:hypothetical protein